ncbi:MAG: hypothetical protein ABSH03_08565 [Candidatus Lustribacter sp.]
MNARATAIAFALLAIVLTVAQDVYPARDWYHAWQYTAILGVALLVMAVHAWRAWRGLEGPHGKRIALALAGAVAVGVAGLLSGLIGPDNVTVFGTPGTVTPVPDLGAAAFFAPADPGTLPRGDATVTLRRRDAPATEIGRRPTPVGLWVVFTQLRPAAYIEVRNERGERLTITQPNNPSFLSPVILFRQQQQIHDRAFPLDTFAVPALGRIVHVLYFSPADLAALPHDPATPLPTEPGAILSVTDEAGAQQGITLAPSGRETDIAGMRVTLTLGTYPVLEAASAPQPFVMLAGTVLFLIAGIWSAVLRLRCAPLRIKEEY